MPRGSIVTALMPLTPTAHQVSTLLGKSASVEMGQITAIFVPACPMSTGVLFVQQYGNLVGCRGKGYQSRYYGPLGHVVTT